MKINKPLSLVVTALIIIALATVLIIKLRSRITALPVLSDSLMKGYLEENVIHANFGGKTFCEFDRLGTKKISSTSYKEYVLADCQEFYLSSDKDPQDYPPKKSGTLNYGTGASLLAEVTSVKQEGAYRPVGYFGELDGGAERAENRVRFPSYILYKAATHDQNSFATRTGILHEQQAHDFYNVP